MSINFNNNNNIFNQPLANVSGFKAVLENDKDQLTKETKTSYTENTEMLKKDLDLISESNKNQVLKQEEDSHSTYSANCFESMVQNGEWTEGDLITLYRQFALNVSNKSPEARKQMDMALASAMMNAFKPNVTMDAQSRNAIDSFKQIMNTSLTRSEMQELFVRFSREISVNFPEAWKELDGILNNYINDAHKADTSMDAQSRSAISNFKSSINSDLTKDDMTELFVRFSREISVKYPEAWNELSSILSNSIASAYVPDNTMDNQSRNAISSFRSTLNSNLTKDDMTELFIRFSREVSVNFPQAWNELESILNNSVGSAFVHDTSMDNQSRDAIANFKQSLSSKMTQDEMVEIFIRFSREISVNYPDAWKQLESHLTQYLPDAFAPVTTIDKSSKELAEEFVNKITIEKLSASELDDLFGIYLRDVSLGFTDAKKQMELAYISNLKKAQNRDQNKNKEAKMANNIIKDVNGLVNKVNSLNEKAAQLSFELANSDNKDQIDKKLEQIDGIEADKNLIDFSYSNIENKISSNKNANKEFSSDYKFALDLSKDRPDDKILQQNEMNKVTHWDMLRQMRRKEVLGILNNQNKEDLIEQLSSVPKHILKKILLNQTHEQQSKMLMQQRFPEALLRSIPLANAKKQLPNADEMLPVMMMTGTLSNGMTGMELVKGVVMGDFKAEKPENQTKAREEIVPFISDMLVKPQKFADLVKAAKANMPKPEAVMQRVNKPIDINQARKTLDEKYKGLTDRNQDLIGGAFGDKPAEASRGDRKIDTNQTNKNRLMRIENLSIGQLLELARKSVDEMCDDDVNSAFTAKRGGSEELMQFLEAMDKVDSLAGAKLAVATLYNNQQQVIKQAVLPHLNRNDMVKLTLNHGKDKEDMVKDMPSYTIQGQIKNLPKVNMIDSFRMMEKSDMIGAFKQLPSQVIASIAYDTVDRNEVSANLLNQKGFAAA